MNLIDLAAGKSIWLCTAESLTAGAISAELAKLPGASRALIGGIVSYQDEIKSQMLGVSTSLIQMQSSVDPEVAAQMALSASQRFANAMGLDSLRVLAVAVTGVAGPDSVADRSPGEVFIALARGGEVSVHAEFFEGGRDWVRAKTVERCFSLIREHLDSI